MASQFARRCAKSRPHPSCASIPLVCVEPPFHRWRRHHALFLFFKLLLKSKNCAKFAQKVCAEPAFHTSTGEEGAGLFFSFSLLSLLKLEIICTKGLFGESHPSTGEESAALSFSFFLFFKPALLCTLSYKLCSRNNLHKKFVWGESPSHSSS